MSESALDPEELEAIQAAIRQVAPPRSTSIQNPDATPLALIATDREAMSARPRLLAVGAPWARQLEKTLRSFLASDVRVETVGAEIVHGRSLRDEMRATWRGALRVSDRPMAMVVAIGGSVIEAAAARRCGANQLAAMDASREPSAVAIRLFEPAGKACIGALARAWRERETFEHEDAPAADAVEALFTQDAVIAVTLTVSSPCSGRIKLFAPPSAAPASAETRLEAIRAEAHQIKRSLGNVPVELRAVLGTVELSLTGLRDLEVGTTFALPNFVDAPVPVYVGGVLKAHGRPVVSRGVIAVEIETVLIDQPADRGAPR